MVQVSGWNVVWQRCQAAATDKLFYHSRTLLPQPDGACRSYESHYLALDGVFGRMRRQTSGKRRMLTKRRQPLKASKLGSHMQRDPQTRGSVQGVAASHHNDNDDNTVGDLL